MLLVLALGCSATGSSLSTARIERVFAQVRGIACAMCAATMEIALRRRLEGVADISISQREQTNEVRFGGGDHTFSPEAFRKAVGEAGVVVLSFQVDACGSIEQEREQRWLVAGKNRFLLTGGGAPPPNPMLCVSGQLDDRARPPSLDVTDVWSAAE